MSNKLRRSIALLLALVMTVCGLPLDAYAAEADEPAMTMELLEEEAAAETGEEEPVSVSSEEGGTDSSQETELLSVPVLTAVETLMANENGSHYNYVSVSWEGFEGVTNYEILRKTPGGTWETAGYSAESPFCDHDVTRYTEYVYTVRCVDENDEPLGSYDETGITHFYPSGTCGDAAGWKLTADGLLTISGSGDMTDAWNMEQTPWYPVRSNVKRVKVETGITSVAPYAFQGCTALTSVTLADTVQEIGQCAFFNCCRLTEINIPEGVTEIPYRTFYLCTGLTSLELPSTLTTIGYGAFDTCTWLADVTLPEGLTSIGKAAFSGCDSIKEIVIPEGVTELGMNTFRSCSALESVTLPESLETLGGYVFADCNELEELTIPAGVTSVGTEAFADDNDGITVTFMGQAPGFSGPVFREKGTVLFMTANEASWLCVDFEALGKDVAWMGLDASTGICYYPPVKLISAVREGDGIRLTWEAVDYADSYWPVYAATDDDWEYFAGPTGITEVSYLVTDLIPGSDYMFDVYALNANGDVVSLGNAEPLVCSYDKAAGKAGANLSWRYSDGTLLFTGKGAMAELETLALNDWWYYYRQEVTRVILPEGLTHISAAAFADFSSVNDFVIPSTVKTIGDSAFCGCSGLKKVYFRCAAAPTVGADLFCDTNCTAYYPQNQSGWTQTYRNQVGSHLTWAAWNPSSAAGQICDTPVLTGVTGQENGICITWEAAAGADRYHVFRAQQGRGWTKIADTTAVSYLDTTAAAGVEYTYTVRAVTNGIYSSWFDTAGLRGCLLGTAKLTLSNQAAGVQLSWTQAAGAAGYRIYRYSGDGEPELVGETGSGVLKYTDTTAVSGETWNYCIQAYNGKYTSDSAAASILYLAQPTIKLAMASDGITVQWNKVEGATGYWLFRKGTTGSWTGIEKLDGDTLQYTDTGITSGSVCYYTVRAMNGGVLSSFHTGVFLRYLSQPKVTVANTRSGILVAWNKVSGAAGYSIYRRTASGRWTTVKTVDSSVLQYSDLTVKDDGGTQFYYTVRAHNGSVMSTFDGNVSIVRLTQPVVKLSMAPEGITVSWNKVEGADGYWLFRKGTTGSWTTVGKLDGDTFRYTDTSIKSNSGSVYYYTVRAMRGTTLSTFDSTLSLRYLAEPSVTMANAANGVLIAWKKVGGAAGYMVFRRTETSGWSTIGKVGSSVSAYTDTTVQNNSGTKYYYTVRAYNGNVLSTFDTDASIMRLAQPVVKTAMAADGIAVSWNKIEGADSYWVFRRAAGGGWKQFEIVDGDTVSLVDTDIQSGTTYYYTVRAAYQETLSSFLSSGGLCFLKQPVPVLTNTADGIRVSWDQSDGAHGYYVCRRAKNTGWTVIATVERPDILSYVDTTVRDKNGETYYYTVRAYSGSVMSTFSTDTSIVRG